MLFIRSLYGAEDFFDRALPRHPYLRHVIGMFAVGAVFTALFAWTGHYYVEGVGYATIFDTLTRSLTGVGFLLLLCLLKLVATSVTLGSGASGGIFSPALFMGATLGAAFGAILQRWLTVPGMNPAVFALAGMAGVVAGATGAALTAIVMIFEMTLNYAVILPLTITAAVSYGVRRMMLAESIYTMKLVRRGHVMPEALQANAHLVHHVGDIAMSKAMVCPADLPPTRLDLDEGADAPTHYVVVDGDRIVGVVAREWALGHPGLLRAAPRVADVAARDFVRVLPETTMFDLLVRMQQAHAHVAVVATSASGAGQGRPSAPHVLGVVSRADMTEAIAEGMEIFGD